MARGRGASGPLRGGRAPASPVKFVVSKGLPGVEPSPRALKVVGFTSVQRALRRAVVTHAQLRPPKLRPPPSQAYPAPPWRTLAVQKHRNLQRFTKTLARLFRPTKAAAVAAVVRKRPVATVLQALDRRVAQRRTRTDVIQTRTFGRSTRKPTIAPLKIVGFVARRPRRGVTRARLFRPTRPAVVVTVVRKRAVKTVMQALRQRRTRGRVVQTHSFGRSTRNRTIAPLRVAGFAAGQRARRRYVVTRTKLGKPGGASTIGPQAYPPPLWTTFAVQKRRRLQRFLKVKALLRKPPTFTGPPAVVFHARKITVVLQALTRRRTLAGLVLTTPYGQPTSNPKPRPLKTLLQANERARRRYVVTHSKLGRPPRFTGAPVVRRARRVTTVLQALDRRSAQRRTNPSAQLTHVYGRRTVRPRIRPLKVVDFCGRQVAHRRFVAGHVQLGKPPRLFEGVTPPDITPPGTAGGGGGVSGRRRSYRVIRHDLDIREELELLAKAKAEIKAAVLEAKRAKVPGEPAPKVDAQAVSALAEWLERDYGVMVKTAAQITKFVEARERQLEDDALALILIFSEV